MEAGFSENSEGDYNGFFSGSENGMVHQWSWENSTPKSSVQISPDGLTADLLLSTKGMVVSSGRTWNSLHKVEY